MLDQDVKMKVVSTHRILIIRPYEEHWENPTDLHVSVKGVIDLNSTDPKTAFQFTDLEQLNGVPINSMNISDYINVEDVNYERVETLQLALHAPC
ncbi:hypothetical protein L596_027118 [Steinernema carpocapsae]|uniref:Uncharacterized protein n=1 Tax=Steinernema carpocapsae TaxID=34508 RepID=A0A4U5M3E9_STECR|nr:hypothetical protein L596_027118 [Steinernema carpocapsae]